LIAAESRLPARSLDSAGSGRLARQRLSQLREEAVHVLNSNVPIDNEAVCDASGEYPADKTGA